MPTAYIDEARKLSKTLFDAISYIEKSRKRRLLFAVIGSVILLMAVTVAWKAWRAVAEQEILRQDQKYEALQLKSFSLFAIETLKLCEQSKKEGVASTKDICDDAEKSVFRAISDSAMQARAKRYLDSKSYSMVALLVKQHLELEALDKNYKNTRRLEATYISSLNWIPASTGAVFFIMAIFFLALFYRARPNKSSSAD